MRSIVEMLELKPSLGVTMDRWNWIAVRAFGPAAVALMAAVLATMILSYLPVSPLIEGLAVAAKWIPLLLLAVSLLWVLIPGYRLWQWQRCEGPSCPRCGGPLGHERTGYASRGGAYRCCYACGGNINHKYYE